MRFQVKLVAMAPVESITEVEAEDEKDARIKAIALARAALDPKNPNPPRVYWDIGDSEGSGIQDGSVTTEEVINLDEIEHREPWE